MGRFLGWSGSRGWVIPMVQGGVVGPGIQLSGPGGRCIAALLIEQAVDIAEDGNPLGLSV